IEGYLSFLKDLREQVKNLLDGLPQEALDWQPIPEKGDLVTNSIGALCVHLAGSENFWMKEVIGRQPIQRDREAEFVSKGVKKEELNTRLDGSARSAQEALSSLDLAKLDETRRYRDRTITVQWAILHVIEHYAIHIGHMQLTRQLWLFQHGK
ncbi:MAG: DUF664 domain-containing protein, partial [Deltaproteobacteria bacterium]|nr:DUF664 domain-containing protein [Deltaproteobacteria bacterium]